MANRLFIIFTDFDGVFARVSTWGNDTLFRNKCKRFGLPELGDLDIYALNRLDRLCRGLDKTDKIWLVSTSTWKRVFNRHKTRRFITKWAGLKKIQIVHKNRKSFDRMSPHEPYTRIKLIRWYLDKYKPTDYVVFDDQYESILTLEFSNHYHHTDQADGISFDDYVKFRGVVSGWSPPVVSAEREKAFDTLMSCIC